MAWSSNNRAHTSLYGAEIWIHKNKNASFPDVGTWKTDFIVKFAGGSPSIRAGNVTTHAEELDEIFTSLFRAAYESGVNRQGAIESIESVLGDSSKNMSDLADVVDENYKFKGEV